MQQWYTCPNCGLQFQGILNQVFLCPRCHHSPVVLGKRTVRLSAPMPQGSGPVVPVQPTGNARRPFSSYSLPVRIAIIAPIALLVLCVSVSLVIAALNPNTTRFSATPADGGAPVAQNQATRPAGSSPTAQASATPTPTATTKPTATPKPTATATPAPPTATPPPPCPYPAVNNNPWCYTFTNTGKVIYHPDPGFCGVFACIGSFGNSAGYVIECRDGEYSTAGGLGGACSHHGGYQATLYMP